ncbi:unnamed protein product, partial [Ectocarpus fasciculatus]
AGWLRPTIGWLTSGDLHRVEPLRSKYDSVSDYAEVVCRMWTMLSFYWGTAALWPRCRCLTAAPAGGDSERRQCSVPLLTRVQKAGTSCSSTGCGRQAVWKCFKGSRSGHDAICESCLSQRKKALSGPINRFSSTDIYDGNVSGLGVYGDSLKLNLSAVRSRHHPQKDVNWRTSYRLQPAALVAVIYVQATGLGLSDDMRIHWGELVTGSHGATAKDEEYRRRSRGEATVRLLSRADCDGLPTQVDTDFYVGGKVVLIDLQVFVPEVISVLATLSSPSFLTGLNVVPFSLPMLGRHDLLVTLPLEAVSTQDLIWRAITTSQLDCLSRLAEKDREEVAHSILRLRVVQTLDHTQGKAFASGLFYAMHCTQGPPGTGKSYVGVCLVLALVLIRDANMRKRDCILGPILTLSYKNHALDEFLLDVLRENPQLKARGRLIRLGKPDEIELMNYTEKSSIRESEAKRELERRLSVMRRAKDLSRKWMGAADIAVNVVVEGLMLCVRACDVIGRRLNLNALRDEDRSPKELFDALDDILKEVMNENDRSVRRFFRQLVQAGEHWACEKDGMDRFQSLLYRWMSGETPPPRCEALANNNKQCCNTIAAGCPFCELHSCCIPGCNALRLPARMMCMDHACESSEPCDQRKLSGYKFCTNHSCVVCVDGDNCGKTACAEHRCGVEGCDGVQIAPFNFCKNHCCTACLEVSSISPKSFCKRINSICEFHRCGFDNCDSVRKGIENWCDAHLCHICSEGLDCSSAEATKSGFCAGHRCSFSEEVCINARVSVADGRVSSFCQQHTCLRCIELNKDLNQVVFLPRYTCFEHPMCQGSDKNGNDCPRFANSDQTYCDFHDEQSTFSDIGTCCGRTKKKKMCTRMRPDDYKERTWYCPDHANQRPSQSKAPAPFVPHFLDVKPPYRRPSEPVRHNDGESYSCCVEEGCSNAGIGMDLCPLHLAILADIQFITVGQKNNTTAAAARVVEVVEEMTIEPPLAQVVVLGESDQDFENAFVPATDLDEMEVDSVVGSDSGEDSLCDEQKRLDEIFKEDDDDESIDSVVEPRCCDMFGPLPQSISEFDLNAALEGCMRWGWEMTMDERQKQVYLFVRLLNECLKRLSLDVEGHIDEARRRHAEASGDVLKSATVVGGTIVGAAKRLPAIRAAEPFAIVVEEACEVLEPTLAAVITVESVQKLELIGDHRQLPAFVQNCWYNVERSMASIKTSLFERLVMQDGEQATETVCTVLDVQRRMRSSISDLTKCEYDKVVKIIDHECVSSQKVGDRVLKDTQNNSAAQTKLTLFRNVWFSGGRNVPGAQKNIFFWDLVGNAASRPMAGLSACNENEADACTQLTNFFLTCGVPPQCITVITPYSGQKRLLVKKLRDGGCLPGRDIDTKDRMLISTVDRYQGDENDIVILSLVRTKAGNRFVQLVNRFIVAASRARLGFFIVGSKDAVVEASNTTTINGPEHWVRFIKRIQTSQQGDEFSGIGPEIPIRCPQHRVSRCSVQSTPDHRAFPTLKTWGKFCTERCVDLLQCGHECGLPCHLPQPSNHEKKCTVPLKRPCIRHGSVPLRCSDVSLLAKETLINGLIRWECDLVSSAEYKNCSHSFQTECHHINKYDAGVFTPPQCEANVEDYIHPECNHKFPNLRCHQRQKYVSHAPRCELAVQYTPSCGHNRKLPCYKARQELIHPSPCKEDVNRQRPRCGHGLSLRCHKYASLISAWEASGGCGINAGMGDRACLVEGQCYGPPENTLSSGIRSCEVPVRVKRQCGHYSEFPCGQAFDAIQRKTLSECREPVRRSCVCCEETVEVPCCFTDIYDAESARILPIVTSTGDNGFEGTEEMLHTAMLHQYHLDDKFVDAISKGSKCNTAITFRRSCYPDHRTPMRCNQLLNILLKKSEVPTCKQKVHRALKCGHTVDNIPCKDRSKLPEPVCKSKIEKKFSYLGCSHENHTVVVNVCGDYQRMCADKTLRCEVPTCVPLYRCGHITSVLCCDEALVLNTQVGERLDCRSQMVNFGVQYCQPCAVASPCKNFVSYTRDCGHVDHQVHCDDAFQWAQDGISPPCLHENSIKNPLCGHILLSKCFATATVLNWNPWRNAIEPPTKYSVNHGDAVEDVVCYPFPRPEPYPATATMGRIACDQTTWMLFTECEHTRRIPCSSLYDSIDSSGRATLECDFMFEAPCEGPCRLNRHFSCHDKRCISAENLAKKCTNAVLKRCAICNVNDVETECGNDNYQCGRVVTQPLPCGHEATWTCGVDANPMREHDRNSGVNMRCKMCVCDLWGRDKTLELNEDLLRTEAEKLLVEEFGDARCLVDSRPIVIQYESNEKARESIISKLQETITKNVIVNPDPPPYIGDSISEYIRANYDLVYLEVPVCNNPDPVKVRRRFESKPTPYGKGLRLKQLKKHVVHGLATVDGHVTLCLALAYRANVLTDSQPFACGEIESMKKLAHVTCTQKLNSGFDAVKVLREDDLSEHVYWRPAAVVPLSIVKLQFHSNCSVCASSYPSEGKYGAMCPNNHFLCWGEDKCFQSYLEASQAPGAVTRSLDAEGRLTCPECSQPYSIIQLASSMCPEKIVEVLMEAKTKFDVRTAVDQVRAEEEEKMRKQLEEMRNMDAQQREIRLIRIDIENVLTPRCPRPECRMAFVDFDGCFALTCGNARCRAGFCAWCFKDCGDDAHAHVAHCPEGNRDVFGDLALLETVWNRRRLREINRLLHGKPAVIRKELQKEMRDIFEEYGVDLI